MTGRTRTEQEESMKSERDVVATEYHYTKWAKRSTCKAELKRIRMQINTRSRQTTKE